jgi:3-oxoacyl-[acyl-carrier-protein] synthase II
MKFAITGVGVVAPIGVGEQAFWDALAEERSAIARVTPGEGGLAIAARVGDFGAKQVIAPAQLRRMPRLAQMTIVAARQALAAAEPGVADTRIGVVTGTGLGTVDETMAFTRGFVDKGAEGASPMLFPVSVMNAVAGQLALECKLRGVNTTVNHRDHSALSAITLGCDMLELGRADALVVAAFDELSAPVEHGYVKLGGVARDAMRPYDVARDGLVPGEGAAAIVLEREDDARRRGARVRAVVAGRGETGEHRPRVGWGHDDRWPEAERAVAQAAAGRAIDWIAGGGNGTALDERELATIARALGALPPTSSILGQTGEFFASGMLRVVAAIGALTHQAVPGTVGLSRGPAQYDAALPRRFAPANVARVLVPSFAQGGANCALVLER